MSAPLEIFRALADPTRLRIITLLRSMELSVGELAQVLGQSQPRVSRHVKILVDAGLVDRRKEGAWVFIALSRGDAVSIIDRLMAMPQPNGDSDRQTEWDRAISSRLETHLVRQMRALIGGERQDAA